MARLLSQEKAEEGYNSWVVCWICLVVLSIIIEEEANNRGGEGRDFSSSSLLFVMNMKDHKYRLLEPSLYDLILYAP